VCYVVSLKVLDALLQAPLVCLKQALDSLCVPLLKEGAGEEAVQLQRRQVRCSIVSCGGQARHRQLTHLPNTGCPVLLSFSQVFKAVKLYRNMALWHEVLSAVVLAPLALSSLLSARLAPALSNRVARASGAGEAARQKAVVEAASVLQVLAGATPPLWVAQAGKGMKEVRALLDAMRGGQTKGPLAEAATMLSKAFGLS
jgi:hypothetical protein